MSTFDRLVSEDQGARDARAYFDALHGDPVFSNNEGPLVASMYKRIAKGGRSRKALERIQRGIMREQPALQYLRLRASKGTIVARFTHYSLTEETITRNGNTFDQRVLALSVARIEWPRYGEVSLDLNRAQVTEHCVARLIGRAGIDPRDTLARIQRAMIEIGDEGVFPPGLRLWTPYEGGMLLLEPMVINKGDPRTRAGGLEGVTFYSEDMLSHEMRAARDDIERDGYEALFHYPDL